MSQLPIEWVKPDRDRTSWLRELEIYKTITSRVTLKEASYRLGMSAAALGHALAERDRHHMPADSRPGWCELAQRADMATDYGNELVRPLGLVTLNATPLTAEQKLARLEKLVDSLGPLGARLKEEAGL